MSGETACVDVVAISAVVLFFRSVMDIVHAQTDNDTALKLVKQTHACFLC